MAVARRTSCGLANSAQTSMQWSSQLRTSVLANRRYVRRRWKRRRARPAKQRSKRAADSTAAVEQKRNAAAAYDLASAASLRPVPDGGVEMPTAHRMTFIGKLPRIDVPRVQEKSLAPFRVRKLPSTRLDQPLDTPVQP